MAARRGAGRDVLAVGMLLGVAAASYWGFAWWTTTGGQPLREVRRDVPEAALVDDARCVHRYWDGTAFHPPAEGVGTMPEGFVPSTVIWCREDGRVQEAPWTAAWSAELSQPDLVWALAPVIEGPCPAVAHERLDLLVVAPDGSGYRPRTPQYPCGERMQGFVELTDWR